MSRWRIVTVVALLIFPLLALAGIGSYHLWTTGWGWIAWWPMMLCMAAGWGMAYYWQRKRTLLYAPDFTPEAHWTERDAAAWKLVEARAEAAKALTPQQLGDFHFYATTAQEMAQQLAQHYHPGTPDPLAKRTVPELLAVIELASHDLGEMVDQYLPGGHLLTVSDWKRARQIADWYKQASNVYWAVSALFDPVQTGMRYVASRVGLSSPLQALQDDLLLWFHTAFLHRLGTYLIELNSGRLSVGATRYRELKERMRLRVGGEAAPAPSENGEADSAIDDVHRVGMILVGQVKAGKSSLINALLGEQRARTDVIPATDRIERYELKSPGVPTQFVLLDTVGYGHEGPSADDVEATAKAAQESDLMLLVLHARNPGRQADLNMLTRLDAWFAARPHLKAPPVLAVMTHVDLLSPSLEWAPPYDWVQPKRPKEVSIHDALATVEEQLGGHLDGVVPVCAAAGKEFGVKEALLPAVALRLDEVHGVALLRVLHAEARKDRVRKVFHQLLAAGKQIAEVAWGRLKGGGK